jgi:thiosulfate dehydrogenase [quinone] large subunit
MSAEEYVAKDGQSFATRRARAVSVSKGPKRATSGVRRSVQSRSFGAAIVVLRAFLGVTFIFAALQKLANPAFFNAANPASIQAQIAAFHRTSPISSLLGVAGHNAVAFGMIIALSELAVGLGVTFGVLTRIASLGGMLISTLFFLSVSYHVKPYYYGSDIVFVFAWTPLVIKGDGGLFSLSLALRRRLLKAPTPKYVEISFDNLAANCANREGDSCGELGQDVNCAFEVCPLIHVQAKRSEPMVVVPQDYEGDRRRFLSFALPVAIVSVLEVAVATLTASIGEAFAPKGNFQAASKPLSLSERVSTASRVSSTTTTTLSAASSKQNPAMKPKGVPIGPASSVPVGQVASFSDPKTGGPAYLLHPKPDTWDAFSAICPHAGCTVMYEPSNIFACPCHGSEFEADSGTVIQGPAAVGLSRILVVDFLGQLYVVD